MSSGTTVGGSSARYWRLVAASILAFLLAEYGRGETDRKNVELKCDKRSLMVFVTNAETALITREEVMPLKQ